MTAPAAHPAPRSLAPLLLFGVLAGVTFTVAWWLGSPMAAGCAAAGGAGAIPLAWGITRLLRRRPPLGLAAAVLLVHLVAAAAGVFGGLPIVEGLKFLLQGTLLGAAAGMWRRDGALPPILIALVAAFPLVLGALA